VIDAVVLAGGADRGQILAHTGVAYRPLLEVGGRSIIQRTLGALRGAAAIRNVSLVAPEPVQAAVGDDAVDMRVPAGESFLENIVHGVEAASGGTDHLLLLTGDLPLITPEAINDFVERSLAAGVDACYPIIPKESCERRFPGSHRTYARLREGVFTGGNGVVVTADFVPLRRQLVERLYLSRKNPLKLAAMFGLGFIFGLITGRLTLPQLEARAGAIISGRVAAIISTYPELGFDVDKLEDLYLARRVAEGFAS